MHIKQCLIALLLVFGLLSPAWSTEIPVDIKADTLKYIEGTPIIEALGSVEVTIRDVTIHADRLRMDSETNVATAEGNVRIYTDSYSAISDFIVYDASREVSDFSGFETSVSASNLKDNLHLSAHKIRDHGDRMLGEWGALTTCDYEQRHFYMTAQRVELYPEDKVLGYNAVLFVGKMPSLWLPLVFYDLSRKQKQNFTLGHNEVEGDYIKSAWGYPYGILYLDQMQKKGFGHGTWTPYALGALGAGTFYLSTASSSIRIPPWTWTTHCPRPI
jgi:LPS-assembly protein